MLSHGSTSCHGKRAAAAVARRLRAALKAGLARACRTGSGNEHFSGQFRRRQIDARMQRIEGLWRTAVDVEPWFNIKSRATGSGGCLRPFLAQRMQRMRRTAPGMLSHGST